MKKKIFWQIWLFVFTLFSCFCSLPWFSSNLTAASLALEKVPKFLLLPSIWNQCFVFFTDCTLHLAAIQEKRPKSDLNFPFLYDCRVIETSPMIKKKRIMRWINRRQVVSMECLSEHRSRLMTNTHTLASLLDQETPPWRTTKHSCRESIPYEKLNFPAGMPIEDQSDDDDGYWM